MPSRGLPETEGEGDADAPNDRWRQGCEAGAQDFHPAESMPGRASPAADC
jgi:hypothetical protein